MHNFFKITLVLVVFSATLACKEKRTVPKTVAVEDAEQVVNTIPQSWIDKRVKNAQERLGSSDAGKVVWKAMEAHGGLKTWYSNGALAFRFNYQPLDGSTQRDSDQIVDIWSNRALHHSTTDSTASYGWTGTDAWVKAKDTTAFAYDTKFWSMTPLYLMGFPFVLDGEGVNLELLPQSNYLGKKNDVVKITFDADTGDAPDDYYILHFDSETHKLIGTRYIVSYPQYFKKGEHLPEKFMEIGALVNVEGILLPNELKTHWTKNGLPGEYLTLIEISDFNFRRNLPKNFFDMPDGAKKL